MAEITDLLKLNYSQSFDIQGMQEADINLSLSPAVPAAATVYGTVTDGTNPLPNATVKLFDSQGVPYRHVLTDTEGAYAFTNVPAGTYTVAAACAGHLMSPGAGLTLTGGDSLQVPLVCAPEPHSPWAPSLAWSPPPGSRASCPSRARPSLCAT